MFQHYLITRFNLRNPKWDVTKNNESLLTDAWMEDRMWLFDNFCFPSVTAQTNQDFEWLLFFDSTTSGNYKNRILNQVKDHANIKVFFIDGMPAFYPEIRKYIEQNNPKPFLITSRIDNDDCIHKGFIHEIQSQFRQQEYQAIDVIKGYTLQVKPTYILGKKEHIFNPFISLIEKNDNPKTVWFSDHNMWKKETRITQISNKRLWLSVIHEKNKVNEFDGYGDISWPDIHNDFIVSKSMDQTLSEELTPFRDWWFLSLKNFLYVKMVLFSKVFKKKLGIYKIK
ncbi:MAG: glycosyltransferase [Flavobacterium sp.]